MPTLSASTCPKRYQFKQADCVDWISPLISAWNKGIAWVKTVPLLISPCLRVHQIQAGRAIPPRTWAGEANFRPVLPIGEGAFPFGPKKAVCFL